MRGPFWVWINWIAGLIDWKLHFRMGIILGTIPSWFLVFCVCVPGCSRNGSGVRLYLWVQQKFVLTEHPNCGTLSCWIPETFFVTLPSISAETCVIKSSLILGTDVFRDWPFLGRSSCVSLETAASFQCLHLLKGNMLNSSEDWIIFLFLTKSRAH